MVYQLTEGSILNPYHRQRAALLLAHGRVVAVRFLTGYGLLVDATQSSAVLALRRIVDRPSRIALACMLPPELLSEVADFEQMTEPFRILLSNPDVIQRDYRLPHFLQIPLKPAADLPATIVTPGYGRRPDTLINIWCPGYRPVDQLLQGITEQGVIVAAELLCSTLSSPASLAALANETPDIAYLLTDSYPPGEDVPTGTIPTFILSTLRPDNSAADPTLLAHDRTRNNYLAGDN